MKLKSYGLIFVRASHAEIAKRHFKTCFVRFRTKRTVHVMHTASFISINCIILIADFNLATNIMQFMLTKLAVSTTCTVLFDPNLTKHILKQFHEILLVEHSFLEIKQ